MDSSHSPPSDNAAQVDSDTKPCPYCGEILKSAAFVCRFCRRDLFAPNAPPLILSPTDWEIARPPSMVSEFVRMESAKLPVSPPVWSAMCLGLTVLIGLLCVNLSRQPDPPKRARQTQQAAIPVDAWRPPATALPAATPTPVTPPPPRSALDATEGPRVLSASKPISPTTRPEEAATPTAPVVEPPPPPLTAADKARETAMASSAAVSASVLVASYLATPAAAEDKFTNHLVHISGSVVSTGKNENGVLFAVLKGTNDVSVRCLFAKSVNEMPPVEAGGIMRVYGTCDGKFIDVLVSECVPG